MTDSRDRLRGLDFPAPLELHVAAGEFQPPTLSIVITIEDPAPAVRGTFRTEADEYRMAAWLAARPELGALIERAAEIAKRERAA